MAEIERTYKEKHADELYIAARIIYAYCTLYACLCKPTSSFGIS